MRNKDVVQTRLERLESEIKNTAYLIRIDKRDEAYDKIEVLLEHISDIRTFLNGETQD